FHDDDDPQGCGLYQVTQRDGQRWSAANAFLDPVRHRGNLQVRTGCQVARVLFEGRRAVGVELVGPQGRQRLRARAEVLLCAGAVHSPQLLLLSGVGDPAALHALGIEPVADLPGVGRNLQDHLDVTASMREHSHAAVGVGPRMLPRLLAATWRYARRRDGLLSSNAAEAGGFARSSPGLPRPDLQLHFLPSMLRDHGRRLVWGYGVTLHVCALRPASRGSIRLQSPDVRTPPRIDPAYLSHPDDLPVLRAGLRLARRVLGSPAWGTCAGLEWAPGVRVGDTEAELDDYIREHAETIYHPAGSCRMGDDAMAVVDSRLRVRGVDALRVVDASIMPTLVGGNTNAPSMMIGEMAADFLLGRA
ncbi:MAG: GMC family oxidoreductase N-terminal domain-containing protein, partial [Betaproteobacteria bacterium]|nr:GMC family oxidoreductase N-terminal domain-containing protein [Betaproteobacteria bacterium]